MNRVKLGDVAFERRETCKEGKEQYPIVGLEHLVPDQINLTEWSNDPKTTFTKFFHKGDVLFGRRRAYLRKAVIAPFDGICSGDITVISAIDGKIDPELLPHIVQNESFFDFAVGKSDGSLSPRVKWEKIEKYEFELPSLDEQKKLAEVLWSMVESKEAYQALLQKTDELVKARFVEMFGTPYGNEKGFPLKTVDDVIEFTGGSQPDKKYFEYEPSEDNIRLIQIRDYKTDNYVTYIPRSMAKRFCYADDIMIGRYGPPIFQILKGIEGSYNVALMKATPKMGNKEFVRHFLMQDCLFNYLDRLSQRTAGQSGIEMPALKAYPFPYPPIELQNQFEQFVKQIDKSKSTLQQTIEALNRTYKKIIAENLG